MLPKSFLSNINSCFGLLISNLCSCSCCWCCCSCFNVNCRSRQNTPSDLEIQMLLYRVCLAGIGEAIANSALKVDKQTPTGFLFLNNTCTMRQLARGTCVWVVSPQIYLKVFVFS